MSTIEQKAHEEFKANRALKEKYHIPYNCWIDWFTRGYDRAVKDNKEEVRKAYLRGLSDMQHSALESFINGAEGYDDFERDLEEEWNRLVSET